MPSGGTSLTSEGSTKSVVCGEASTPIMFGLILPCGLVKDARDKLKRTSKVAMTTNMLFR